MRKRNSSRADSLVRQQTRSCGCLAKEIHAETGKDTAKSINNDCVDGTKIRQIKAALDGKKQSNNTTGHTGVNYDKSLGIYKAFIKFRGMQIYLGSSKDINVCIALREEAEQRIFGDFLDSQEQKSKNNFKENDNDKI